LPHGADRRLLGRILKRVQRVAPERLGTGLLLRDGCAARVARYRLGDPVRTARLYRRVLALAPTHSEALTFLSEHFAAEERWDDLVEVYETSLAGDTMGSPIW